MSTAFAGAAAASNHEPDDDTDVTFDNPNEIDDIWVGQEIAVGDLEDASGAEIREGFADDDDADNVERSNIDNNGYATFETDELEDDEVYHLVIHGDDTYDERYEFWAYEMDFEAEFDDSTVVEGQNETIEFDSERDGAYDVNITSDDFDGEELSDIFTGLTETADDYNDDDDALELHGVENDEYTAEFNVEPDDYDFDFDVLDTVDEDNASINVSDEDLDYYFGSVDTISEGEIANVTIGVGHSDTAAVVFGDEDDGHVTEFEVNLEDSDADEVILQFNSHTAADDSESNGWSAYDDDNVSIENIDTYTELDEDDPLPEHRWDLQVGDSLDNSEEWALEDEYDRDVLQITPRSSVGDVTLETVPTDQNLNDFEDYEDATVTETNTVANQDHLLVTVDDFGAEGAIEAGDWDSGIYIELEEQNTGPIGSATVWNTSDDNSDAENLSAELLNEDDYNGDLIYVVDYEAAGLESDEDYDVRFNVTEENEYVDDDDEEFGQETDLSLVDREVEWDAISEFPADSEATGTTTVAPGTELDARADSSNDQGSFVEVADAEVTEGDDGNHKFAASFEDLENEESGVLFDLIVEDPYSDAEDTQEDVKLLDAGEDEPATFNVNEANAPSSVEPGDDATLDVTIENTGDVSGMSNYSVVIDGEQVDEQELDLNSSETFEESYEFDTSAEGDIEWEVATDDDEQTGTLTVEEGGPSDGDGDGDGSDGDGSDGDSDDDGDGDGDDGTPGFGVAVALFALLAAAMLALRQQH